MAILYYFNAFWTNILLHYEHFLLFLRFIHFEISIFVKHKFVFTIYG